MDKLELEITLVFLPLTPIAVAISAVRGNPARAISDRLRRIIDSYHLAIERLTSIDAPVVAAVSTTRPMANLLHLADGFADNREDVVTDLSVRHEIIGTSISLRSTNSSISMVLVDSSATFSSSFFVTSMKVSVSREIAQNRRLAHKV